MSAFANKEKQQEGRRKQETKLHAGIKDIAKQHIIDTFFNGS